MPSRESDTRFSISSFFLESVSPKAEAISNVYENSRRFKVWIYELYSVCTKCTYWQLFKIRFYSRCYHRILLHKRQIFLRYIYNMLNGNIFITVFIRNVTARFQYIKAVKSIRCDIWSIGKDEMYTVSKLSSGRTKAEKPCFKEFFCRITQKRVEYEHWKFFPAS